MNKRFFSFAAVLGLFILFITACTQKGTTTSSSQLQNSTANSQTESQQVEASTTNAATSTATTLTPNQTAQVTPLITTKKPVPIVAALAKMSPPPPPPPPDFSPAVTQCGSTDPAVVRKDDQLDGVVTLSGTIQAEKRMNWDSEYHTALIAYTTANAPKEFLDYNLRTMGSTSFVIGALKDGAFSTGARVTNADAAYISNAYRTKNRISLKLYFSHQNVYGSPDNFTTACRIKVIK